MTAVSYPLRPGARRLVQRGLQLLLVVLAAAAAGAAATALPGRDAPALVAAGPAAVIFVAVIRRVGPRWCLAALVIMTSLGWYQISTSLGRVNLRLTDLPYVGLLGWAVVIRSRRGSRRADMGQTALAVLLGVLGLSLLPVLAASPHSFFSPFVSWARLVETFTLVWLVPYAVEKPSDRRFIIAVVAAACSAELLWALLEAAVHGRLSQRLSSAHNGPDAVGLLAAILAVTVLHGAVPRRKWLRVALFALALTCLGLSRSVGAIAAAGLVIGLAPLPRHFSRKRWSGLLLPGRALVMIAAVLALVVWLRPSNAPGSSGFQSSTTSARLIYATDGIDQFVRHPILGVGFQRSQLPQNFADPAIVASLHRSFPAAPRDLFPDPSACVTKVATPGHAGCDAGGVHNSFVQIAAEAGAAGLLTLVIVAWIMYRRIRRVRRRLIRTEYARVSRWAVLVLLVVVIWWNDNPLFGAQPETVMAALTLGTLAVPWLGLSSAEANDRVGSVRSSPAPSAGTAVRV